jgi:hypothetical protein
MPTVLAATSAIVEPPKGVLMTSCREVVHVGDSCSLGLISAKYIPNEEDRLEGRYRAVGVQLFYQEIRGGRSIVERLNGHPNAYTVVSTKHSVNYKGCYVMALGNGDSANVKGDEPELSRRIDSIMRVAAGQPVLWTTTKTLLDKGPYQNQYIEHWNSMLVAACARHPNMRVFDYASEVKDDWYLPDKIHPNDLGAKERADRIAKALAVAFPKDGPSPDTCLVHSTP